jgi:uncharacterized protein (DUF362 family)
MNKPFSKDRREFVKKSMSMGLAVSGSFLFSKPSLLFAKNKTSPTPDLVMVNNGEPDALFNKAIQTMGGMRQFVKKGQIVLVKPNIGFPKTPDIGATTNPLLVKTIIEHCFQAGAKKVYMFDNVTTSSSGKASQCYKDSGIENAAKSAGAVMVPADEEKYYQTVEILNAKMLQKTSVHETLLESDVFINVPILKHHSYTSLSIAMKNLMGVVWNRMDYHFSDLDQCIADFCLYRKPDLNIVDAYRVMTKNGPSGMLPQDAKIRKTLIISKDIVAVDAAATKFFGHKPDRIRHIKFGHEMNIGSMKLDELNIQKYTL